MEKDLHALIADENFTKIENSLKKPNIFSALSVERQEIRHSNFLAYLFNPGANHGLGDYFLKEMLHNIIQVDPQKQFSKVSELGNLKNARIKTEWENIDILILLDNSVIIIENKIGAKNHSNQLRDYRKKAEKYFKDKKRIYSYLTINSDEAETDEDNDDDSDFWGLSGYSDIAKIIEQISIEQITDSSLLSYLADYLKVIKRNLLNDDETNVWFKELYGKCKGQIDFLKKDLINKNVLNNKKHNDDLIFKNFQDEYNRHKEVFKFILNNIPNPLDQMYDAFKDIVGSEAWDKSKRDSKKQTNVRFVPKKLKSSKFPLFNYNEKPEKQKTSHAYFEVSYKYEQDKNRLIIDGKLVVIHKLDFAKEMKKLFNSPKKYFKKHGILIPYSETIHKKIIPIISADIDDKEKLKPKIYNRVREIVEWANKAADDIAKVYKK
ncbi:MAG: PD-(D/E)XK nuclease family protein [Endomicrobia bacterium]|nr:PD-(D/E)XK nuclease family protein [Endomicrobiia bacterium]MCL2507212.1 PD-(D/E)XK nuclease family protein [Endomicrobiia bacterium]